MSLPGFPALPTTPGIPAYAYIQTGTYCPLNPGNPGVLQNIAVSYPNKLTFNNADGSLITCKLPGGGSGTTGNMYECNTTPYFTYFSLDQAHLDPKTGQPLYSGQQNAGVYPNTFSPHLYYRSTTGTCP
jgi:hypothetical protein